MGRRTVTHIQRTRYHGVYWLQIIWRRLKQMHKLSHLNASICPKYIVSLSSGREVHSLPFPPAFLPCHMTGERPIPALLEVLRMLERRAVLQLSHPEAPSQLDTCLCVLGSGRDRDSGWQKGNVPRRGLGTKDGKHTGTAHTA